MRRKILLFITLCCSLPIFLFSQEYQAAATLDSTHILIGDYLNVNVSVTIPAGEKVIIPEYNQAFFEGTEIEWIANSKVDTLQKEGLLTLSRKVTVTSFEAGKHRFPGIKIRTLDSAIVAETEPLEFEVATVDVDMKADIKDIKQPVDEPFTLKELLEIFKSGKSFLEILPYILIVLGVIAIITLIIYFILKNRKKPMAVIQRPKPKIRPDILALSELEKLRQKT